MSEAALRYIIAFNNVSHTSDKALKEKFEIGLYPLLKNLTGGHSKIVLNYRDLRVQVGVTTDG